MWRALYDDELALEGESRDTWEIEPCDDGTCLLTVVHDRWIDKYTEGRVSALLDLKAQLEETA